MIRWLSAEIINISAVCYLKLALSMLYFKMGKNWVFHISCANSLVPGRSGYDLKNAMFNVVLLIGVSSYHHNNALRWVPQDLTDDKSTLVYVMAWCHQATSHYLNQCWPRSPMPYSIDWPQCVNNSNFDLRHQIDVQWLNLIVWNVL